MIASAKTQYIGLYFRIKAFKIYNMEAFKVQALKI